MLSGNGYLAKSDTNSFFQWVIHMATRRPVHNMPIHMDFGPFQRKPYKKSMRIGVLWAGMRVAMWTAHVGEIFRHGLLEKSLIYAVPGNDYLTTT